MSGQAALIFNLVKDGDFEAAIPLIEKHGYKNLNLLLKTVIIEHTKSAFDTEQFCKNKEFMSFLIDRGADMAFNDNWALRYTLENCAEGYILFCLDKGADPNAHDGRVIDYAFGVGCRTFLIDIIDFGGDLNLAQPKTVERYLTSEDRRQPDFVICFENGISALPYINDILCLSYGPEDDDAKYEEWVHQTAMSYAFYESLVGHAPQPDLSKPLMSQKLEFSHEVPLRGSSFTGKGTLTGFDCMLINGRLEEALDGLDINMVGMMEKSYSANVTIQYMLSVTNQLHVPFQKRFWDDKTVKDIDDFYQTLTPLNRKKVSDVYEALRNELIIDKASKQVKKPVHLKRRACKR